MTRKSKREIRQSLEELKAGIDAENDSDAAEWGEDEQEMLDEAFETMYARLTEEERMRFNARWGQAYRALDDDCESPHQTIYVKLLCELQPQEEIKKLRDLLFIA